jgi:hypothetical protein
MPACFVYVYVFIKSIGMPLSRYLEVASKNMLEKEPMKNIEGLSKTAIVND